MIRIVGGRINWMSHCSNRPTLELVIDNYPIAMRTTVRRPDGRVNVFDSSLRWEHRDGIWFCGQGGLARWFSHPGDEHNHGGFGGSQYEITLVDGSTKILRGPWSSRAGVVNDLGFGPVIEGTWIAGEYDRRHVGVLVSVVRDALDKIEVPDYVVPVTHHTVIDTDPDTFEQTSRLVDYRYDKHGPDVHFPMGSRATLVDASELHDGEMVFEPAVLLPSGEIWRKSP